jgi:CelD/BcsL family acetyltransferase involved in cellulose biosynthesis
LQLQDRVDDIQILRSVEDLIAIATEWDVLCDDCPWATPFQRPAWQIPLARHLAAGSSVETIAIRRGGRLVAVLPLERRGDAVAAPGAGITDYTDVVLAPDATLAPIACALAALAWRTLALDPLPLTSPLHALAIDGADLACEERAPSPVVPLPRPAGSDRLGQDRRKLARAGEIAWTVATRADLPAHMDALFALHAACWSVRGQPGVLADRAVQAFHRDAARALCARGLLRLIVLRLDGRPVATVYGFLDHDRFFSYLGGFEPALHKLSPGALAIDHAMTLAELEGAREYDLLRGREAYKYAWGAIERPARARRFTRR